MFSGQLKRIIVRTNYDLNLSQSGELQVEGYYRLHNLFAYQLLCSNHNQHRYHKVKSNFKERPSRLIMKCTGDSNTGKCENCQVNFEVNLTESNVPLPAGEGVVLAEAGVDNGFVTSVITLLDLILFIKIVIGPVQLPLNETISVPLPAVAA